MNNVMLIGRLTKDVEVNYTQSQMAVGRFTIALDRGKDKNGESRGADFPNCVAFGKTAENMEKFTGKGKMVGVQGHLQTGSYEKDGVKHYTTDVIADRVEFLEFGSRQNGEAPQRQSEEEMPDSFEAINEDVPF